MEPTAGLATPLTRPDKLGILAKELKMLSKLAAPLLAAGTGVVLEAELILAAGLATVLLAMLSIAGGAEEAEGTGAVGAEPPMEVANPANDGMLVAMMSVTPASVGKPLAAGGGASSPEEAGTVMSSSDMRHLSIKHAGLLPDPATLRVSLHLIREGDYHSKGSAVINNMSHTITERRLSQ